jgi:hypothetical protein
VTFLFNSSVRLYLSSSSLSILFLSKTFNLNFRMAMVFLIKKVGLDTQSQLANVTKNAIFFATFMNTAMVLLLVNADMSQTGIPIFDSIFTGKYPDFDSNWYDDIGANMTKTMLI